MLLKTGEIISRNLLIWLEILITRYCCIYLVVYIICINDARSNKYQTYITSLSTSSSICLEVCEVRHKCSVKNIMCTLVQALKLCTDLTAQRGSRGIVLRFHDHGTRRGWGVSVTPRPLFTPGKNPVPIVQEAEWALGPVWTGAENFFPTRIRYSDRPPRSQSLYRLRYPGPLNALWVLVFRSVRKETCACRLTTPFPFRSMSSALGVA